MLRALSRLKLDNPSPEFYGGSYANNILNAVEIAIHPGEPESPSSSSQPQNKTTPTEQSSNFSPSLDYLSFLTDLDDAPMTTLPPRSTTDTYIMYYLETIHRLYPILNPESFTSYYEGLWAEGPRDVHRTALVYIVLALVYQTNAAVSSRGKVTGPTRQDEGAVFYALAKNALTDVPLSGGGLAAVQTMFLAVGSVPTTPSMLTSPM